MTEEKHLGKEDKKDNNFKIPEEVKVSKEDKSISSTIKKNPWILSTLVFGVLAIILLVGTFSGTGHVSKEVAGKNFVNYINSLGGSQIEYVSSKDFGSNIYEITLLASGQKVPAHITSDGRYFVQILADLKEDQVEEEEEPIPSSSDVPKSDKPVVELFVMSHCPYGTQAEKGILPVVELLGEKIDFELRFVYYAMHPSAGEVQEQLNQYCIQEEQEELFNDYLTCFLDKGDGEACLTEVGVDKTKLDACFSKTDAEFNILENLEDKTSWLSGRYPLFDIHKELNELYKVGGSPTLVINGVQASSGRAPANYLDTICQAFKEAPEECDEVLVTSSFSPGFGYDTTSASTTAQCG